MIQPQAPSPAISPSLIALPLWAILAAIALVADIALLYPLSPALTPTDDHTAGLTELRWIALIMIVPAAWLIASLLLARRLSPRPLASALPLLVWSATAPAWMYLAVAAAAVTTAGGLLAGRSSGVALTPVLSILALGPATLTCILVALHTRARAPAIACIAATLPAIGALHLLEAAAPAPFIWTLIVTYFILHAAASHTTPAPAAPQSPPPKKRPPNPAPPNPACPTCGYTGPTYLGSPCPGCGAFTG